MSRVVVKLYVKVDGQGRVKLPAVICRALNLKRDEIMEVNLYSDKRIELVPTGTTVLSDVGLWRS